MNEVENKVNDLLNLYMRNRRSGATTILKEVATNHDVSIILLNQEMAREFGKSGVSINSFVKDLMGTSPKPIFLDNGTMMRFLQEINSEFQRKEELIDSLNDGLKCVEEDKKSLNRTINLLNEVVVGKQKEIEHLEKLHNRLSRKMTEYSKKNWFQRMLKNI